MLKNLLKIKSATDALKNDFQKILQTKILENSNGHILLIVSLIAGLRIKLQMAIAG